MKVAGDPATQMDIKISSDKIGLDVNLSYFKNSS
jgi:hypothetical protein